MKFLINGCSFSRGPGSWPYHVVENFGADICNLAQAGAGNNYIKQSTIVELGQRNYDFVLIMWSGLERFDLQVEDIDYFKTPYTSKYQSAQNDWAEKIVLPINDQDYVEKNWVFGVGHINSDPFLTKNKLFSGIYKYVGGIEHIRRSLVDIISLQDFLRARSMRYAFSFYQNYLDGLQSQKDLWNLIDRSSLIPGDLSTVSYELNDFDPDGLHPGLEAHRQWAQHVISYLRKLPRDKDTID